MALHSRVGRKLGFINPSLLSWHALLLSMLMAAIYSGFAWLASLFFPSVSPFWPAAAFALAGVMLFGRAVLLGVFLGSLLSNLYIMTGWSWLGALVAAVGNSVSLWFAVLLFRRATSEDFFATPKSVGLYSVLPGLTASVLSAAIGMWGFSLSHAAHFMDFFNQGLGWMLGDLSSAAMLTPALYLWGRFFLNHEYEVLTQQGVAEFAILMVVIVGGGLLLFGINSGISILHIAAMSLVVPPLIWGAQRFSPRLALTMFAAIYLVATGGTLLGHGPLADFGQDIAITALQLMGAAIASSVLIASVQAALLREANEILKLSNTDLSERVLARTRELEQSEQRTRYILEMMPMPMLVTDLLTNRVLYVNEECLALFETSRTRIEGMVREWWVDPLERQRVIERLQRGETIRNHEVAIYGPEGKLLWISMAIVLSRIHRMDILMFALRDISSHKQREAELLNQATVDSLTGLYNRRQIRELMRRLMLEVEVEIPFAFAILDLDFFKRINDGSGHACGDKVLQEVANLGRSLLHTNEWFGRWGGEEFVVGFPGMSQTQAHELLETFRERIADHTVVCDNGHLIQMSASFGLSEGRLVPGRCDMALFDEWVEAADQALYRAKKQGRNRIELA